MAAARTQEASSSMSQYAYHVFLSFRGKDIRRTFIDHLYASFVQAGIHTFRDDDEIEVGEDIGSELKKAIEQSRISIIVFSKDYASSRWCLDELVKILERRKTSGQVILPVFYDVDPSEVSSQTGSFGEAFARHREEFEAETDKRRKELMDKLERWREALSEVANLAQKALRKAAGENESMLLSEIVQEVRSKLNRTVIMVGEHMFGVDNRIKRINLWLQDESDHASVAVIYGMGGIGKTTIAKTVYNLNFERFTSSSFLAGIREVSKQPNGLLLLQRQLLRDILKVKGLKIRSVDQGIVKIKNAISCKKVFIVLDDVDQLDQLNTVIGMREWLYPGSKVIITTRYERLLKADKVCKTFKVNGLDHKESFHLFCWHAFGQDHPVDGYIEHSERVLQHCEGLPLALKVLGSSLRGRSVEVWESALQKLEEIPNNDILETLAVSYESLQDDSEKTLLLYISCFFIGKDKEYVVDVLDKCELYPTIGIQNLVNRCLITIEEGKLMMHQLLQDMAKEIIRKESPENAGERTILCHEEDSFHVLSSKTGTKSVQGVILDMHMLREDKSSTENFNFMNAKKRHLQDSPGRCFGHSPKRQHLDLFSWKPITSALTRLFSVVDEVNLTTGAFAMMHKLRLLKLTNVHLSGGYKEFPKELRWLCWHGFPMDYIPSDFPLASLVSLDMQHSSLKQVWKGMQFLRLLKFLNLSYSHSLARTPDFTGLPSLERLAFKYCIGLVKVHDSIADLKKLVLLNLRGCKNLRELPRKIDQIKSIQKLILSGCSQLERFQTGKSWPIVFWSHPLKPSKIIDLPLLSLPSTLVKLKLSECNLSDNLIPKDFSALPKLLELDLSLNPISRVPESIKGLTLLKSLYLDTCRSLQSLPELPSSLKEIIATDCKSLERMALSPSLLKSLDFMWLDGCDKLTKVDGLFRLEPIGNFDKKIINKLGLVDLESMGNIEVELCNSLTFTARKGPLQGLFEFGIFSTFLPGSGVPAWFSNKSIGPSVSFTVPLTFKLEIQGLRVCVAYMRSERYENEQFYDFYIKITNKSRVLEWTYGPMFYSNGDKDMLWLSHWNVRNQLQIGDEVDISMVVGVGFKVKECGIDLVYRQEEQGSLSNTGQEVIQHNKFVGDQDGLDVNLSYYQRRKGVYVLCNYGLYPDLHPPQSPPNENWGDPEVYDPAYWNPILDTGEEGNEEEENDEDDF